MARDVRLTALFVALVAALVEPYMPTKSVRELEMPAPKVSCGLNVGICRSGVCATMAAKSTIIFLIVTSLAESSLAAASLVIRLIGTVSILLIKSPTLDNKCKCSSENLCFGSLRTIPSISTTVVWIRCALARVLAVSLRNFSSKSFGRPILKGS